MPRPHRLSAKTLISASEEQEETAYASEDHQKREAAGRTEGSSADGTKDVASESNIQSVPPII